MSEQPISVPQPDRHEYWLPVIGSLMKRLDQSVGKNGLVQSFRKIVGAIGKDKLLIRGKDEYLREILEKKPVVVITNHPHYGEIFAGVAALEPRDDIHIVGISNFLGLGPNVAKYVHPIYMTEKMAREKQKLPVWLGHRLHIGPQVSFTQAARKNVESMRTAAQHVRKGGLIAMSPDGIRSDTKAKWPDGVGYLLARIGKDTNAFLVYMHVDNVYGYDLLRLAPGVNKLFSPIAITFSKPQNITTILEKNSDSKTITTNLEEDYRNWANSLVNNPGRPFQ